MNASGLSNINYAPWEMGFDLEYARKAYDNHLTIIGDKEIKDLVSQAAISKNKVDKALSVVKAHDLKVALKLAALVGVILFFIATTFIAPLACLVSMNIVIGLPLALMSIAAGFISSCYLADKGSKISLPNRHTRTLRDRKKNYNKIIAELKDRISNLNCVPALSTKAIFDLDFKKRIEREAAVLNKA
jgi:hypothetical protein